MRLPLKLAIAGTHSTGKSTFLQSLSEVLQASGVRTSIVADLGTDARDLGFPILREQSFETTSWIIARGICLELEAGQRVDVVLVDRPVVDPVGYFLAAAQWRDEAVPTTQWNYLSALLRAHTPTYDVIFKTVVNPELPIDTSQPRDTNPEFRFLVANAIDSVFARLSIPFRELSMDDSASIVSPVATEVIEMLRLQRS